MKVRSTTRGGWSRMGAWRRWKRMTLVVLVVAAGYVFIRGDGGLGRLYTRWRTLGETEARALRLEAETDSLRQVLWLLENDLDYVEKVAREEYGMSRASERVYRLPPMPGHGGGD